MGDGIAESLQLVFDKLPEFLHSLDGVSPYLLTAVIGAAILRWSIIPLIRAWKDKD